MPNFPVPGPVPYAPGQLSPAPQTNLNIAQMMMDQANRQAAMKQNMWNNVGQGIAGVGQDIASGMREASLAKDREVQNKIRLASLSEAQDNIAAQKAINEAIAGSTDADGNVDWVAARKKVPAQYTVPALKQMADAEESTRKMRQNQFQDQQQNSDFIADQAHQLRSRFSTDADGGIAATGVMLWHVGKNTPFAKSPEFQQLAQLQQQAQEAYQKAGNDPGAQQAVKQAFDQHVGSMLGQYEQIASPATRKAWDDEAKAQMDRNKPIAGTPGQQFFDPVTHQPIPGMNVPKEANPGTFEDYALKRYGPRPSPGQLLSARQEWERAGQKPTDPLVHALAQERVDAARQANEPMDVTSDVRTTASGKQYLDLGDYQTPTERSKAAAAAKAAGVMAVPKEVGQSLQAADTAKQNFQAMWAQIESKLPKDASGRVLAGPGNKLSQYFQTDAQLSAFNSWRAGAIQAVQALVEKGVGFRMNQAEINLIMQNDMPQVTDTVDVAHQRINNVLTLLANKENSLLSRDRSAGGRPNAGTPGNDPLGIR